MIRMRDLLLEESKLGKVKDLLTKMNKAKLAKTPRDVEKKRALHTTILQRYKQAKVLNPETGKQVFARTAINYGPDHPAYQAAAQIRDQTKSRLKQIGVKSKAVKNLTNPNY